MQDDTQHKENKDLNKKSLIFKTRQAEHITSRNTLATLKQATTSAESIDWPNRYYLLELYFDIVKDAHLASTVKHRKGRVKGLEFGLVKTNGSIDKKTTDLFGELWFSKFLDFALDAIFYGNSLIELVKSKKGLDVVLIPRENVIPEFQMLKTWSYQQMGDTDYSAPIHAKTLVDVNNNYDSRNLGEFLAVTKLVLLKNEVTLNWSQFTEIYGQPLRVATSISQDPVEINSILNQLKDIGRSGYMVKDPDTEIDFLESSNTSSSSTLYDDFQTFMNEEISKKIVGGTMITDSGSSRSQSEVHERGLGLYTKEDVTFIENVINNQLIPILKNLGFISTKGVEFKFEEPEILTVAEKIEQDSFIMLNFKPKDIEYFEKRYGTSLEFKTEPEVEVIEPEVEEETNED